jgi:hypothetical protein
MVISEITDDTITLSDDKLRTIRDAVHSATIVREAKKNEKKEKQKDKPAKAPAVKKVVRRRVVRNAQPDA